METNIIEIEQTALSWPEKAKALIIVDAKSYTDAANLLKEITAIKKKIKEHHRPMIEAAYEAHRQAVAAEKRFLEPLAEADKILRTAIDKWNYLQASIKAEKEAEARRLEEERRIAAALKAQESGADKEAVDKVLYTLTPITVPIASSPTIKGISTRETWHAEVTDLRELCKAVAEGNASIEAVQANMTFLNAHARLLKDEFALPGVKATKETSTVIR